MELYTKKQMQDAWFVGWLMGCAAMLCARWLLDNWTWATSLLDGLVSVR